ncbi:helix-turn-helix transcriptional regulator [Lactobacillus sp. ESL0791]|uniref:helix-turn-helix domain-containing protein n=1 Tax=Lactobacillus sp. ESL0791 TaxID=2983234 RepID=UPI0023F87B5F|nr:helix-turn-helix transcriptional regulator [Lactobacillus sp. ESL0791]MDF7639891.1 helix-turn-helix transcriptional regulator [Lactobacillus sp. ESL0791]
MTIGELLKKYRIDNAKTQKEWVNGIVSPSYYAKVEKDLHRITAEDLAAILTANNISIADFFNQLGNKKQTEEDMEAAITRLITQAFYHNSVAELEKIKQLVNENKLSHREDWLLYIDAFIALLDDKELAESKKAALKEKIFNLADYNDLKLVLYCNFLPIYDFDSNLLISERIIAQHKDDKDLRTQEELLVIIGNMTIVCIENNRYEEAQYYVKVADQLPVWAESFFYKNLIVIIKNLLKYHDEKKPEYLDTCKLVIKDIELVGMPAYANEIKKFIFKNKR